MKQHPLPPGTPLRHGDYTLKGTLGIGGFGITYRGFDNRLNRHVAIKEFFPKECVRRGEEVHPGGSWDPLDYDKYKRRFLEEGRKLAQLDHPGVVRVYDACEERNTAYLVMEYLEGKTLAEWHTLEGRADEVLGGAFSPDGTLLTSGAEDGTVRLWGSDRWCIAAHAGGAYGSGAERSVVARRRAVGVRSGG